MSDMGPPQGSGWNIATTAFFSAHFLLGLIVGFIYGKVAVKFWTAKNAFIVGVLLSLLPSIAYFMNNKKLFYLFIYPGGLNITLALFLGLQLALSSRTQKGLSFLSNKKVTALAYVLVIILFIVQLIYNLV